jgi:hypothetical protein
MGVRSSEVAQSVPFDVDSNGFPTSSDFVQEAIESAKLVKRTIDFVMTVPSGYSVFWRSFTLTPEATLTLQEDAEMIVA